jgi:hypothetical protein
MAASKEEDLARPKHKCDNIDKNLSAPQTQKIAPQLRQPIYRKKFGAITEQN